MDKLLLIYLSVFGLVSAQREKSKFSNVRYAYYMVNKKCDELASDLLVATISQEVIANNQPSKFIKFLLKSTRLRWYLQSDSHAQY